MVTCQIGQSAATSCVDYQCPLVPNFTSFWSAGNPFELQAILKTSAPKAATVNLNSQRYTHHICVTGVRESQISLSFAARRSVFEIGENSKCTELPQTDLKHLTVYIQSTYPRGSNFGPFAQRPAVSRNKVVETRKRTEWLQTDLEHYFFEWICGVLSGVMSFEIFPPIWSHVTKQTNKQNKTTKTGS